MVKSSEVFAGFEGRYDYRIDIAKAEVLKLHSCCPVEIHPWDNPYAQIIVDANSHEKGRFQIQYTGSQIVLKYPSEFNGGSIESLHLPNTYENLPRVKVFTPTFERLVAFTDYYGHLFSKVHFDDVSLVSRGKAEGYLKSRSATISAWYGAAMFADITGGAFIVDANEQSRITGTGEFTQVNAVALNGGRIDTFGPIKHGFIAATGKSGFIQHKGSIIGRVIKLPERPNDIVVQPK